MLAHPPEDGLDEPRAARIEADHRLVDEHGARPVQKRGGHDQTLLHAVREALDELVLPARELEHLEHLVHALGHAVAVHAVEPAVKAQELPRRELLVDERPIGNEPERGLGGLGAGRQIVAVDEHAAGRRPQQPGDHPDGRRLSGAVRSQETVNLTRLDVEAHAVDRREGCRIVLTRS